MRIYAIAQLDSIGLVLSCFLLLSFLVIFSESLKEAVSSKQNLMTNIYYCDF